jgi:hypothetical protein
MIVKPADKSERPDGGSVEGSEVIVLIVEAIGSAPAEVDATSEIKDAGCMPSGHAPS